MNLPASILVISEPSSRQSSLVRNPSTKKLIAACTSRSAAEAAARLLLWDHIEWYGTIPQQKITLRETSHSNGKHMTIDFSSFCDLIDLVLNEEMIKRARTHERDRASW